MDAGLCSEGVILYVTRGIRGQRWLMIKSVPPQGHGYHRLAGFNTISGRHERGIDHAQVGYLLRTVVTVQQTVILRSPKAGVAENSIGRLWAWIRRKAP